MAKNIQNVNTPTSEAKDVRTAGSSATGALNGANEGQVECQLNGQPTDSDVEAIRTLAHSKWEAAGCPTGDGVDFWLQAELELKAVWSTSDSLAASPTSADMCHGK